LSEETTMGDDYCDCRRDAEPAVYRTRIGPEPIRRFRGWHPEHAAARAAYSFVRSYDWFANEDPWPAVRVLVATADGLRWRVFHPDTSLADYKYTYLDLSEYPPLPVRS
jgi:hypothetical protein